MTARDKPKLRSDLYEKMVKADPSALSADEHTQKGVTKWRYLQWKDKTTSTSTLGFRIEGRLVGMCEFDDEIIIFFKDMSWSFMPLLA